MRILLINKFYFLSGGAERYVFEWEKALRARGHEVMVFAMRHPLNRPCRQEGFFANPVWFDLGQGVRAKLAAAARSIWCRQARQRLEALLQAEGRPDIVHLHSFMFQLTPSILKPLVRRGIPIVQTTHEYAHICVNQRLFDHRKGAICEACLQSGPSASLTRACVKGSRAATLAAWAAGWADRRIGRTRRLVRQFLCPSAFMREKMIVGGMPRERTFHVPNFTDASAVRPAETPGEYILFLGRLVPEKGIRTFLRAAALAPEVPCRIAGGGILEFEVRGFVAERKLANIEVLGHREGEELDALIRGARAVAAPSEWYEPFGLVILEAMAAARPVIASRIAGPAEILTDGDDGLLVEPGNAEALAAAMRELWRSPDRARNMGRQGREKVLTRYDVQAHYDQVMRHFEEARRQ